MHPVRISSKDLYLRLLGYVRPYWRQFAVSLLGLVIVAITEPAAPALFKPLLDGDFWEKDPAGILWAPLVLVGIYAIRGLGSYLSSVAMAWVAGKVVLDLRRLMFDRLLALPTAFYDRHSSGTLISKLSYDVSQVAGAATDVLTVLVRDSLAIVGLLAWMFYLHWKLALVSFLVAPFIVAIVWVINRRLRRVARSLQKSMGDMTQVLEEATGGNRVIKIFGGQSYESRRMTKVANRLRLLEFKSASAAAVNAPLAQLITVTGLATIVYIGSRQVAEGSLTVGGFVSFLAAMGLLFSPIKRLTSINVKLQRGLAAAESVFALIDEPPEVDGGTMSLERARGRIEFHNVQFGYEGAKQPALRNLSLTIAPGETVAVVGPSGSGKTTVASLIPRFYAVESGRILLDGNDIRDIRLGDLRANIALVSQDVLLFNDTVAANIAYGANSAADEAAIREAARAAHALDFIAELPDGLQSFVGDRGVRLSGGQRQRLAIARALLKDAPVLILDEATSALDTESERQVQAALEELRKGRTTLVIAHRLSTIENADRIVVLEAGRVLESGSHADLLARGGLYAELYRVQFAAGSSGVSEASE